MIVFSDATFLDYASRGGIIGFLLVIIYGGFKKNPWWVFGWVYRDLDNRHERLRKEKDAWVETAVKGTAIAETIAQLASEKGAE